MKKYLLLILCISGLQSFAQIPNPDFENWTSTTLNLPTEWMTAGIITQISPGTQGNYALKMERDSNNMDAPGAIIYGTPVEGGLTGGIPFNGTPDSLIGNFKYDIPAGDSAWVLVFLKAQGQPISQNVFYLTGSNTVIYQRLAFKLNYSSAGPADSLIIAVTSTNPEKNFLGGYVIVDDLHFTNTTELIPNGDFETWNNIVLEEPQGWYTSNNSTFHGATPAVTKTADSYSGNYAIRIENVSTPNGFITGYALAGPQGQNGSLPGFPVQGRDTSFNGYYKFDSQNNDTLTLGIQMFYQGQTVGSGWYTSSVSVNSYTSFIIPVYYDAQFMGTPDSATIYLLPFQGGSYPHGNSVLYVDNLSLNQLSPLGKSNAIKETGFLKNYPNPFNMATSLEYNLPESSLVEIDMFDITGKKVIHLFSGNQSKGMHKMDVSGLALNTGTYTVVVTSGNSRQELKVLVQK